MSKRVPPAGYITLRQLGEVFNVPSPTLYRWVAANYLPCVRLKVGEKRSRYLFSLEAIEKFLASNECDGRGFTSSPEPKPEPTQETPADTSKDDKDKVLVL
jgi:excisionase family DNA binding protein